MMRYTCQACQQGQHDLCAGRHSPPPGMLGGSECVCDGKCAERPRRKDKFIDTMTAALNPPTEEEAA